MPEMGLSASVCEFFKHRCSGCVRRLESGAVELIAGLSRQEFGSRSALRIGFRSDCDRCLRRVMIGLRTLPAKRRAYECQQEIDRVPRAFAVALVALFLVIAATSAGPATAQSGSLAGVYDGGQMEIAAALELKPDGRFNYALPYGALDEEAAGRWTASGNRVLLSSNPVVPRVSSWCRGAGDPRGCSN